MPLTINNHSYSSPQPQNKKLPSPSASLNPIGGGCKFLESETDTNALIGVLLSLVHPDLYAMQMEVLKELRGGKLEVNNGAHMHTLFNHWSTPFTAFALIVNRETQCHRDTQGGQTLLDVLATFGRYSSGRLNVPLLGSRFVYNPGTSFVLPGHLLEHGASRAHGERVCLASFFRPNVGCGVLRDAYREVGPPEVGDLARHHGLVLQPLAGTNMLT